MAQNARNTILLALAFALPAFSAQAHDCGCRPVRAPIVLNGQLATADFTGGVGYGAGGGTYIQGGVYIAGGSGRSFASSSAFASARASAFASAGAHSSGGHR